MHCRRTPAWPVQATAPHAALSSNALASIFRGEKLLPLLDVLHCIMPKSCSPASAEWNACQMANDGSETEYDSLAQQQARFKEHASAAHKAGWCGKSSLCAVGSPPSAPGGSTRWRA